MTGTRGVRVSEEEMRWLKGGCELHPESFTNRIETLWADLTGREHAFHVDACHECGRPISARAKALEFIEQHLEDPETIFVTRQMEDGQLFIDRPFTISLRTFAS